MSEQRNSPKVSASKELGICLLVALQTDPTLALTPICPSGKFRMGDRTYHEQGYGDWTGFYDWLRTTSGEIVGVRYSPFDETEFLIDAVASFRYVVVLESKRCLEIYFSNVRGVDWRKSDDQEFGSNKIFFCTREGRWLISFDTKRLSEPEMKSLRAADVRWESVSLGTATVKSEKRSAKPRKLARAAAAG